MNWLSDYGTQNFQTLTPSLRGPVRLILGNHEAHAGSELTVAKRRTVAATMSGETARGIGGWPQAALPDHRFQRDRWA